MSAKARKIHIMFHDAGGGHRNAAISLKSIIEQQKRPWQVELVQFQELTDRLDVLRRVTGIRIQEQYNTLLRNGWTLGATSLLRVLQMIVRILHRPAVKLLTKYFREHPGDLLVSVIPHFNRELHESWSAACPGKPFATLITDLADFPPRFWIEPIPEQYIIAGTEKAAEQARAMAHDEQHIFKTSGMIVRPEFYAREHVDVSELKKQMGLREDLPTAIVLFGGYGSGVMHQIARRLDHANVPVQLILICGRNEKLAAKFRAESWKFPVHVIGFTKDVHRLMYAADFMIGKPGPGSIAEAMLRHLPVLIECNAWTLPQERYNAEWVKEKEVGIVVDNFRSVADGVKKIVEPAMLARLKNNIKALNNRALFEIPEMLAGLMGESAQLTDPQAILAEQV
ncbi:MAG TPA: glycosyltransferase [Candidatus Acidoferrum sp.]|nr:glycosyltransferase [Candidatus Acidoferrum sp.]